MLVLVRLALTTTHILFPTRHSRLNCVGSLYSFLSRKNYTVRSWSFTADRKGSTEASETCFDRDVMKIHHHCFNKRISELCNWFMYFFPRMMFGFTAILLHHDQHIELEKVVQHLELDQILLKTNSFYITALIHSKCPYNTPYGLEEVAHWVAQLKNITAKDVLHVTSQIAKDLYGLK